ncbi:PREDICTED: F-box/WD repeat-containing protein 8 [Crocodylus porosus]|uniref:F-box/WD repeat-containing protein 8 n=1 Tax=Crocodylus porosus TaxID=8502 RepID=A0A7M4FVC5_CROPO|nr:PREDICTED: F-box/WD repeat-containing protein 8 [Crocodylus porosus]
MADGPAELELFRRRWREELAGAKRRRREPEPEPEPGVEEPGEAGGVALAWSLMDGRQLSSRPRPPRPRAGPSKEAPAPAPAPGPAEDDLLGQLIRDLNEINEIPFFDVQLPYELALKIFQYLGRIELGRCAQVSRTWKVLAEDEVLWYRLCQQEGYLLDNSISDGSCWKLALKDCRAKEHTLRTNWKNRVGAVSQLQYELGKVLCSVHSCDGVVISGYTSGDVRLWDTRTWDYTAPILESMHGAAEPGPQPYVSFVRINSSLAVAAYEDGTINVWSLMIGREPIHRYQHNQKLQALALGLEGAAIASASGFQVKVESSDDRGYWQTTAEFEIQKLVNFLQLVPGVIGSPVTVAAAEDVVYLLKAEQPGKILHSVYGQPVTCLDVSANEAAFGVKGFGWLLNETNKILLYNLETGQCVTQLGSSLGDFTCVNLQDSPPYMLITGNKDRRVRVYDLRQSQSLCSLYAHHLGVSAVQMDDWKIVSGGEEGLVCVWDQRMGAKLWEIHARHPVRYLWFNSHSLITANIPDEKNPRGASIMDDDLTAHRRHRGIIYAYEFSVDQLAVESILPICRSSYDEATGYNYNIGLSVPYDSI